MSKIALFDLDGTLADFDGTLRRDLARVLPPDFNLPTPLGYDTDDPWLERLKRLVRSQPGWWKNLPRFDLGWQILNEACAIGFDPHILTKGPRSHPPAWAEKVEWCREHLPEDVPVTITAHKALVYGRVLVDDWPPYFRAWMQARPRGVVIVPAQPWNADVVPSSRIVRYDGTPASREAMRFVLHAAFDRETTR